jgi:RNA polymerase sigma-70 factor (ECF subfamily)
MLRRERRTADIDEMDLPSPAPGPEKSLEAIQSAHQVRQAVMALPPASRAVLVLREYEGLSYDEIAASLGIPIGTVMSRLNYARRQLRQSLAVYVEEG